MKGLKNKAKAKYETYKKKQVAKKASAPVKTTSRVVNLPKTGKKATVTNVNLKGLNKREEALSKYIEPNVNLGSLYEAQQRANNVAAGRIPINQLTKNEKEYLRVQNQIRKQKNKEETIEQIFNNSFNNSSDPFGPSMRERAESLARSRRASAASKNEANPFMNDPKATLTEKELLNALSTLKQENYRRREAFYAPQSPRLETRGNRVRSLRLKRENTPEPNLMPPPSPGYNNERKISFEPTSI